MRRKWSCRQMVEGLFVCMWLLVGVQAFGQDLLRKEITLQAEKASLGEILEQVSQKSGLLISYSPADLPQESVSFPASTASIATHLDRILSPYRLSYKVIGKQVAIYKLPRLYTLSGYVIDGESGERLISAQVYDEHSKRGVFTNGFGFFSLDLPGDSISLVVAYTTYKSKQLKFFHKNNRQLSVELEPDFELDAVEIKAIEAEGPHKQVQMSLVSAPVSQLQALPVVLGEADVLKALGTFPGIQSAGEGSANLLVRGGSPDQNLILLDDAPIYFVSHLGGLFSVFNGSAVSDIQLVKGGFPAKYGGRLSSVIDVRTREGNMREITGEADISLIAARASIEGPIKKDRSSFFLSFRRSYFDIFSNTLTRLASDGNSAFGYHFYDLNAKVNFLLNENNRLHISMYLGDDRTNIGVDETFANQGELLTYQLGTKINWGNQLFSVRWNHLYSPKVFANLRLTLSNYRFEIKSDYFSRITEMEDTVSFKGVESYDSGISDLALQYDVNWYKNGRHTINLGINLTVHNFRPGLSSFNLTFQDSTERDTVFGASQLPGADLFLYYENEWKVSDRLTLRLGAHASSYTVQDTAFGSIQPRLSARYTIGKNWALKASFVRMMQFIHLLSSTDAGLPTDLWVPSTTRVPPQRSWQVAAGVAGRIKGGFEVSLEGYYKRMRGLIAYEEGANLLGDTQAWEDRVVTGGEGWAYGVEFLVQKKSGKTTGWLGYTLAWNQRKFSNLNEGKLFPFRYDRRHDLNLVVSHRFSEKIHLAANWTYGSGHALSLATGTYNSAFSEDGVVFPTGTFIRSDPLQNISLYEGGRNGFRMRAVHRLDASLSFDKKKKWGERSWILQVYNLYNRANPFFYFFDPDFDNPLADGTVPLTLKQFSLFPILPSVSYHVKF
ncbi:MAG: carboxypeptidase-like regulatory domain-containing protein [Bacteroidota bacterium]